MPRTPGVLITQLDSKSPVAESYRTLRTNIQFAGLDRPLRTLMITSAGPEEGKSTTIVNLGIAMAQAGTNTIIVGADMRKPALHKILDISNSVGVTSVLLGRTELDEALQECGIPGLKILAAGPLPPNPAELLGSQKMVSLISQLKEKAELILFDTPPVIAVTDAAVLSMQMDGVLLVISAGWTARQAAKEAYSLLQKARANVIGTVLTNVEIEGGYGYYYYYYYYESKDREELPSRSKRYK